MIEQNIRNPGRREKHGGKKIKGRNCWSVRVAKKRKSQTFN